MRDKLRNNGLSIVMFLLFAVALIGQTLAGYRTYNEEQQEHHQPQVGMAEYLTTGHFTEALFENWESEFLQMAMYVILTAFLFQKGSAESNDPDDQPNEDPDREKTPESPSPVHKGGLGLKLYENSLGIALFTLFLISFAFHAAGGAKQFNEEQLEHGGQPVSTLGFMGTSQFWFESFQNWQSEFFSIGMIVVLSIYLRQKNSPESKSVADPHSKTGTS
jgi:hypothetical protein